MTDDTDPGVSAAELQALVDRARLESVARGLRVLRATMREPEVFFEAPAVSLDDALDVAAQMGAVFVTVGEEFFDAADFLDRVDEVPASLRTAAGRHDGDRTGMDVRWVAGGASYAYWAAAAWWRDLTAEREVLHEDEDARRQREERERHARTGELIRAVIADPGIRGAKPASRKALIEGFIRARVDPDEDIAAGYAIVFAPKRVSEQWREAYALLDQTADVFIRDLHDLEEWHREKWVNPNRREVLRRFAMSRTGGWAPTDAWVQAMDRKTAPTK